MVLITRSNLQRFDDGMWVGIVGSVEVGLSHAHAQRVC